MNKVIFIGEIVPEGNNFKIYDITKLSRVTTSKGFYFVTGKQVGQFDQIMLKGLEVGAVSRVLITLEVME